jgi:lipopolysaccharide transport system permease protein
MVCSIVALYIRDVVFSVGYFVQVAMLITPVLYPMSAIPKHLHWIIFSLNPMAAVVETSRWALTGEGEFLPLWLLLSALEIAIISVACLIFFLRAETYLADAI